MDEWATYLQVLRGTYIQKGGPGSGHQQAGEMIADAFAISRVGSESQKTEWVKLLQMKNQGKLNLSGVSLKWFIDHDKKTPETLDDMFSFQ